jgi:hypothetical protein
MRQTTGEKDLTQWPQRSDIEDTEKAGFVVELKRVEMVGSASRCTPK